MCYKASLQHLESKECWLVAAVPQHREDCQLAPTYKGLGHGEDVKVWGGQNWAEGG